MSIQVQEAEQLREKWGDKPCDHPKFAREYYLGANTGDYVCTTCGRCFARQKMEELRLARSRDTE
jgi:hypothetical protein